MQRESDIQNCMYVYVCVCMSTHLMHTSIYYVDPKATVTNHMHVRKT